MDTLAFGYILPTTGRIRDFNPLETCAARRTRKKEGEIAENSLVISPSLDYQPLLHQASSQILPAFHQVCIHSQTHCTDDSGVLAQCRSHHIL